MREFHTPSPSSRTVTFGVNYYERHLVRADPADPVRDWQRVPAGHPTIVGIGVHPEGLREILNRLNQDYSQVHAETVGVTPGPFVVVHEGPWRDAAYVHAVGDGLRDSSDMTFVEGDALVVVDLAVRADVVV